jgi:multidrug efflux pump subunit AcrB
MNFRNISAWSIRNPVPPIVMFIALMLAGIISFTQLSINDAPDVEFPAAIVFVSQPGAAPTELETQVTRRIEAALRGISGVDEINSSVSEGNSQTFVVFAIGTPVDRAVNDVRDAVSQIRGDLPDGILEPQVERVDVAGGPIAYFSAEAVDMTLEQLSWYVDNTVAKRLLSIKGMANVQRSGGVSREIRVVLDSAKAQSYGISAAQVNSQLRAANINAAGGRAEIAGAEQSVRVLGNARSAFALGETQISVSGGRRVKLSDIAAVRDSYAEQRSAAKMGNRQVLAFSIEKAKGSSDVTVYDEVQKQLDILRKENPKVNYTELFTSVGYTKSQYDSSIEAMVEGAILAVLVVFIFLKDWRATAISAVAIPLAAIPTFFFMQMAGFTLNTMSTLALSLVAGVLVDDAIVEIENIVRHMRMGKTAFQASIDAADEIGLAVLATTMAIVAVFLPVGLMPGISGQFFISFGMTVVFAVLLSLAVARLITPMMAAYFLQAHGTAVHGEGRWMDFYMNVLNWSLRNRWKTVGIGGLSFLLTIVAFIGIPFTGPTHGFFGGVGALPVTFQPTIDQDFSHVRVEMVPGSTLAQTTAVTDKARNMLDGAQEVKAAFSSIRVGSADIYMTLGKDRKQSSIEFEREWAPKLSGIADGRVNFQSQQNFGPGNGGRDVIVYLGGDDPVKLQQAAQVLAEQMKTIPELRAPRINGDLQRPEIIITPRMDLAADMGITTADLSHTIRTATQGDIDQNSPKFSLSDRQIPIRVTLAEEARRSLSTIENLPVPTRSGGSVPLKVVADISFGAGPTTVQRSNQIRRISVGADLAPGKVSGDAQPKIDELPILKNPPPGVKKLNLGENKIVAELLLNFVVAVFTGVFLVFAVLVLLYRRVMPPFVNMGSLLLAPLGAAVALHIAGAAVSLPVFIGILMLLGIVAKNSILLVDFALEQMDQGADKFQAILDAGHKRAQPIVMTTIAMVAGMVPTVFSLTGDGAWRQPMGITVIGGLILSTVLTLLIVPATFSLAVGFEQRVGPWLRYWLTTGGEGDHPARPPRLMPKGFRRRLLERLRLRSPDIQPAE